MKLVVGLGNPGKKYADTRHNVGFLAVDEVAKRLGAAFVDKASWEAEMAETAERIILLKPQTFMNLSGRAVAATVKKHALSPEDIILAYDDADLPFGEIRWREGGSAGGHNGVQSVLDLFPKETPVARVRIGIGRPAASDMPLEDWVLGTWNPEERAALPDLLSRAADELMAHA